MGNQNRKARGDRMELLLKRPRLVRNFYYLGQLDLSRPFLPDDFLDLSIPDLETNSEKQNAANRADRTGNNM